MIYAAMGRLCKEVRRVCERGGEWEGTQGIAMQEQWGKHDKRNKGPIMRSGVFQIFRGKNNEI